MTPEQRYLFDIQGFLHLEGALSAAELSAAQDAFGRLILHLTEFQPRSAVKKIVASDRPLR